VRHAAIAIGLGAVANCGLAFAQGAPAAFSELGFGLFQQHCIVCHGSPEATHAPPVQILREMSPERIHEALTTGPMKPVGDTLTATQRRLVAESVSGRLLGSATAGDAAQMPNRCAANPPLPAPGAKPAWNGWGVEPGNSRFQPTSSAGITPRNVGKLRLRWAFAWPGGSSAYGQPSQVSGRVFFGTDTGYVYSLDAKSGCVYWSYRARAGVRNAINIGPISAHPGTPYAAYFGDVKANVYAIDARTGAEIWTRHVADHYTARVTAAPALFDGRLYVPISSWEEFSARTPEYPCCTSVGAVLALDASSGAQRWKTDAIAQQPQLVGRNSKGVERWAPAGASVWNTPTLDPRRNALYFGTGDATTFPAAATSDAVLAVSMDTGKLLWSYQVHADDSYLVGCDGAGRTENCPQRQGPDWDIPGSPILTSLGGDKRLLVIATKPGDVLGLDPDRAGALVWRMNVNGPLATPANSPRSASGMLWGGTTDGRNVYFGLTGGGAVAIELATGKRLWRTAASPVGGPRISQAAAASGAPGLIFLGGSDGRLSALATRDGATLWQTETARSFATVNRVAGKGGSIGAPGATLAGGTLIVGSGYSVLGGAAGNLVIAYSIR
jgi:polyvinyl alcohol dehydrogenase (cytochrome)